MMKRFLALFAALLALASPGLSAKKDSGLEYEISRVLLRQYYSKFGMQLPVSGESAVLNRILIYPKKIVYDYTTLSASAFAAISTAPEKQVALMLDSFKKQRELYSFLFQLYLDAGYSFDAIYYSPARTSKVAVRIDADEMKYFLGEKTRLQIVGDYVSSDMFDSSDIKIVRKIEKSLLSESVAISKPASVPGKTKESAAQKREKISERLANVDGIGIDYYFLSLYCGCAYSYSINDSEGKSYSYKYSYRDLESAYKALNAAKTQK